MKYSFFFCRFLFLLTKKLYSHIKIDNMYIINYLYKMLTKQNFEKIKHLYTKR